MNTDIHPTMVEALKPFLGGPKQPPATELTTGQWHTSQWHPNELTQISTGLYEHQYITADGLLMNCHFEFEAETQDTESEPGRAESFKLLYALVNGVDVSEVISDDVRGRIETEARESMAMDSWDSDYDRAEERALDREAV